MGKRPEALLGNPATPDLVKNSLLTYKEEQSADFR